MSSAEVEVNSLVSVFGEDLLFGLPEVTRQGLNEKWQSYQSSVEEENVAAKRHEAEKGGIFRTNSIFFEFLF